MGGFLMRVQLVRVAASVTVVVGLLAAGLAAPATAAGRGEAPAAAVGDDSPGAVLQRVLDDPAAALADPALAARGGLAPLLSARADGFTAQAATHVPRFPAGRPLATQWARLAAKAAPHERRPAVLRSIAAALVRPVPMPAGLTRTERAAWGINVELQRQVLHVGSARPSGVTLAAGPAQVCLRPAARGRVTSVVVGACPGATPFADELPVRSAAVLTDRLIRVQSATIYLVLSILMRAAGLGPLPVVYARVAWAPVLLRLATNMVGVPVSGLSGRDTDTDARIQLGWPGFTRCLSLDIPHPLAHGQITWGRCDRLPRRVVPALPPLPTPTPKPVPLPVAVALLAEDYVDYLSDGETLADALAFTVEDAEFLPGLTSTTAVSETPPLLALQHVDGPACLALPVFAGTPVFVEPVEAADQSPNTWHHGDCVVP